MTIIASHELGHYLTARRYRVSTSRPSEGAVPDGSFGLGEPLMLQAVAHWFWSGLPDQNITLSPIGLAAWFGLLLTAINLLPIGQLDGGHATYAMFREKAHRLSAIAFFALLPLSLLAPSWLFFALFTYLLGIRRPHPPTMHDETPLSTSRKVMGALGLLTFVLCFTPEPIQIDWSDLFVLFR
jgi:membrane-associated protease RseP (regulator of RpoE activity)